MLFLQLSDLVGNLVDHFGDLVGNGGSYVRRGIHKGVYGFSQRLFYGFLFFLCYIWGVLDLRLKFFTHDRWS